jgi:hypothetical protein
MTMREVYREAEELRHRAIMAGHNSISLGEFTDYVLTPLRQLGREEHARQLEDIRENGT